MKMIELVKKMILGYRIKKAIEKARHLSEIDGRRYMVIMCKGAPRVYQKKELQTLIRRRVFRKGTTIQDIEKKAILITK